MIFLTRTRTVLPVEILDSVFQQLEHHDLHQVVRTNHSFHDIAVRIIYRTIRRNLTPRQTLQLIHTLYQNNNTPSLASLVHELDVVLTGSSLTGNAYVLLNRVFRRLTSLTYLTLELPSPDNYQSLAWIFKGCTFSLRYFGTSLLHDKLSDFLDNQPTITELCLRGNMAPTPTFTLPPFTLLRSSLPNLTHFRAPGLTPPVLAGIIRGRPIESISISLPPRADTNAALDTLCLGTCPIKRLTLMSFITTDPSILFQEVAERIPELEALHLILMSLYTLENLRVSGPRLSAFKALRYLTFMAYVTPTSIADSDERDIARLWHRSCPTLRTIILPKGNVWFEQEGNWAPLDM